MGKKKIFKIFKIGLPFLMIFCSLSINFFAGQFSSVYKLDELSEYQSRVCKENKTNYLALSIEENVEHKLPEPVVEFYNNYRTFKQLIANFLPIVNADKRTDVYFNEIDNTESLSFFYHGPIRTTQEKNDFNYPIRYMFDGVKDYKKSRYVISISEKQANKFIEKRGLTKDENGYKSLLQTLTSIKVGGIDYDFKIGNIFFEGDEYTSAIRECVGEYLLTSYYYPEVLVRSNMYLLNSYEFENKYYMDYINSRYKSSDYEMKVNHYNLKYEVDDDKIMSFYYSDLKQSNIKCYVLVSVSGILCLFSLLYLVLVLKIYKKISYFLLSCFSVFLPFAIFSIISYATKSVAFFSSISLTVNFVFSLFILLVNLVFLISYQIFKTKGKKNGEINL